MPPGPQGELEPPGHSGPQPTPAARRPIVPDAPAEPQSGRPAGCGTQATRGHCSQGAGLALGLRLIQEGISEALSSEVLGS